MSLEELTKTQKTSSEAKKLAEVEKIEDYYSR